MASFDDKNLSEILEYLTERIQFSVTGELLEIEVMHGAESLPLKREFTQPEKQLLLFGALYGARHLVQLQLADADVNAAVKRAVSLVTRQGGAAS